MTGEQKYFMSFMYSLAVCIFIILKFYGSAGLMFCMYLYYLNEISGRAG